MKIKKINQIPGFEHIEGYSISEKGDVYTHKKFIKAGKYEIENQPIRKLKPWLNTKGYPQVDLGKHTKKVHRLVAIAFIPNPENKPQVNHIDGVKTNNEITNLEWVNNADNQKHAWKIGLSKAKKGKDNYQWSGDHSNCKAVKQLDLNGNEINRFKSLNIAKRSLGLKTYTGIAKVANGKQKTSAGYKWEFINEEGSTTIPKGSTPQAYGGGNGEYPKEDKDIV